MATGYSAEYNKEIKRIKSFISRATKRGYRFPENVIPTTPKRVTKKSLERVRAITPQTLYQKATYYDPLTDALFPGEVGRSIERSHHRV